MERRGREEETRRLRWKSGERRGQKGRRWKNGEMERNGEDSTGKKK